MVILLLLHVTQTFLYGSYKGRRELLWLSGCVLFALVLCMAFTGYLLPWDQKAYFATAVGTNIAGEVPFIGAWIKSLMRGGVGHGLADAVALLRRACAGRARRRSSRFVALHVFLFRKAGAAGPISENPIAPQLPTEPFYPRQVVIDGGLRAGHHLVYLRPWLTSCLSSWDRKRIPRTPVTSRARSGITFRSFNG